MAGCSNALLKSPFHDKKNTVRPWLSTESQLPGFCWRKSTCTQNTASYIHRGEHSQSNALLSHPSSVQSLSRVWLFATPWTAARQASLSITNSQSLLKLISVESVMPSNHLILCRPLLLLPSIFPSIRWPKYWSFSFSISPSSEYSGLISFRMDWLDLLAVQWTLKSLLHGSTPQFKSTSSLALSFLYSSTHIHTRLREKP